MSLSRRLFAALMPTAVAAPVMAGGARPDYPPHPPPMTTGFIGNALQAGRELVAPPAYKQFLAAKEAASAIEHARYMRQRYREDGRVELDISVLKSVSTQHKVHMQMSRDKQRQIDERSFTESLIDSLGLRDYFKKRNEMDVGGTEKNAASAGW